MFTIMVTENATQRGRDTAASMDSVAAITERIAYDLLRFPDWESFKEQSNLFITIVTNKSYDTAKGMLLKGEGLGEKTIRKYADENILTSLRSPSLPCFRPGVSGHRFEPRS